MNLFIVGTPHQLHQVGHALAYFNIEPDNALVLIVCHGDDIARFSSTLEHLRIENVSYFEPWTFRDVLSGTTNHRKYIDHIRSLAASLRVEGLFVSHYDSDPEVIACSALRGDRPPYLLDEGNASFYVNEKRNCWASRLQFDFKNLVKSAFYRFNLRRPKSLVFFSQYTFTPCRNDRLLTYTPSRTAIADSASVVDDHVVHFLGSSVVEMGVIAGSVYLALLAFVKAFFAEQEVIYYAHRKESGVNLERIRQIGFVVRQEDSPYEKHLLAQQAFPGGIASFYFSSALYKIETDYILPSSLTMFYFDANRLLVQREIYGEIYRCMLGRSSATQVVIPDHEY